MSMTVQEINSQIRSGGFDNEQLNSISLAIQYARTQLSRQNIRSIAKGATVKFVSQRNGLTYQGTVEKIAIKNVIVRTHAGLYRVPANMLEMV